MVIRNKGLLFISSIMILFASCISDSFAQNEEQDYYKKKFIRNEDFIYKDNIKTVLLYKKGWGMTPPILMLNTDEKLQLIFDDMDADYKYYGFTLIHCDANWQTSTIKQAEYLTGLYEDEIWDYEFSYNTTKKYTNYQIVFPTDYMTFTKSGNYILRVYENENKDENVIFTRRFMVFDQKVTINGRVNAPIRVDEIRRRQAVDFVIDYTNYYIPYPYQKLKVHILQNRRWDNAVMNIQPRMISGNELDYDLDDGNVFDGGNEFRTFDIKSVIYQSIQVKKMYFDPAFGYQVYLLPDKIRTNEKYSFDKDINGKRYIDDERATDPHIEADYVTVHLTLSCKVPLLHGNVYVFGALTYWQFTEEGKMTYNFEEHQYELSIYLKQGYYTYAYVFLEDGFRNGDMSLLEGSHFDTENDYFILVYHREEGTYYDQLIGLKYLNSLYKE